MNIPQYWADMLNRIGPERVEGLLDEMVDLLDSPEQTPDMKEETHHD